MKFLVPEDNPKTVNSYDNAQQIDFSAANHSSEIPISVDSAEPMHFNDLIENEEHMGHLESEIVSLFLNKSENYAFSFSGIRYMLGIHQQTLTNSLDRLVEDSWLVKDPQGNYYLDPKKRLEKGYRIPSPSNYKLRWDETWLGQALNPIPVKKIYQDLHGKWFGKSRFVGGAYDSQLNNAILEWKYTTDTGQTQLEIQSNQAVARFKNMSWTDRDKALEVFNNNFLGMGSIIIFEPRNTLN